MTGMTRRAFAKRSMAAAGVVGTAAWWGCGGRHNRETVQLRKCLSMAPIANGEDPEDLLVGGNLDLIRTTGAGWVRIWIRWDKAQPLPAWQLPVSQLGKPVNDLPVCGTGCGFRYIQAIDNQIAKARAAGLGVILTAWLFPRWANGTEGMPPDWARQDRGSATDPVERLKAMEYRVPIGQLGPDGYYGRWLDWLLGRYAGHGHNLVLEILSEPNHQLWPQQGPSHGRDPFGPGPLVIDSYVAEMIGTATAVSAARGHPILLAGPGLSDRLGRDSRLLTSFETLVQQTLERLDQRRVPGTQSFVWTHHNYRDVENPTGARSGAETVRERLLGRWRGRGGPSDPELWLTEGGARLGSGRAVDLPSQARLVRRSWERMRAAPGIGMWTNYLLYANPVANSGLRQSRESGGAPRPVWDVFRSLKG